MKIAIFTFWTPSEQGLGHAMAPEVIKNVIFYAKIIRIAQKHYTEHVPSKAWVTQWLRKWSEMGGNGKSSMGTLGKSQKCHEKSTKLNTFDENNDFHLLNTFWARPGSRNGSGGDEERDFLRKNHPDRWKTLNWTRSEQGLGHAMAPEVVGKGGFSSLRTARSQCLMKMNDVWTPSIYRQLWKH